MKTTIKNTKKLFEFEDGKGFKIIVEDFEDGLAVIEIPIEAEGAPEESVIYISVIDEDRYEAFISGCFSKESNFREELLKAYECSPDTEFLGFKLKVQEMFCIITEEDSSIFKIKEILSKMVLIFARKILDETNEQIAEYNEMIKKFNDILDHIQLKFKSYRAEEEYEKRLNEKNIEEIGYGEDFVTYAQYIISQGNCDISEAVQETYKTFDYIGDVDYGNLPIIQFICQYCLYGDEIFKSYLNIIMQKFNDELDDL